MPTRNLLILFIAALVSLVCYGEATRNRFASVLSESMVTISDNYVQKVPPRALFEGALTGMLGQLDPYSAYIPPEDFAQFQTELRQEFGGIGVEVGIQDDQLTVFSPVPGTPAYEAGMLAGDVILAVDGQSTADLVMSQAVKLIQGTPGTTVRLSVLHRGSEEAEELTITRAIIEVESIRGDTRRADGDWNFVLQKYPRIGYIRLLRFGEQTADELERVVRQPRPDLQGWIIDLRGNAGGLLTAATATCDLFIEKGLTIVSTRGRDQSDWKEFVSQRNALVPADVRLCVLIDQYSASASEIFAACMQDYHRGEIVGQRSWGKGTVQNVIPIESGKSAIRLTTATYWRPSGRNIHRHKNATESDEWGVRPRPEYEVKLTPEEYVKVYQQRRDRDVLGAGAEEQDTDNEFVDPQLQRGIDYIRQRTARDDSAGD